MRNSSTLGCIVVAAVGLVFLGETVEAEPQAPANIGNCMAELREAALAGDPTPTPPDRCLGMQPLHYAATQLGASDIVKLAAAGANVEAPDAQGLTPLHYAARARKLVTLTALLESGASPSRPDSTLRRTALHYAVDDVAQTIGSRHFGNTGAPQTDRFEIVEILLKRGADVNARDIAGETALHHAATAADAAVLRLLLEAGADPNARGNNGGNPPLFNAVLHGNQSAQRALEQYGADMDAVDAEGLKVLDVARAYAPIMNRFFFRNDRIIKDENLSAEEKAEKMAEQGRNLLRTMEDRYEALKAAQTP